MKVEDYKQALLDRFKLSNSRITADFSRIQAANDYAWIVSGVRACALNDDDINAAEFDEISEYGFELVSKLGGA